MAIKKKTSWRTWIYIHCILRFTLIELICKCHDARGVGIRNTLTCRFCDYEMWHYNHRFALDLITFLYIIFHEKRQIYIE